LDTLELLENVLIVEKRVGELVHEGSAREESVNAALNDGDFEKLVDIGPLCRVSLEHHGDDVAHGWGEV